MAPILSAWLVDKCLRVPMARRPCRHTTLSLADPVFFLPRFGPSQGDRRGDSKSRGRAQIYPFSFFAPVQYCALTLPDIP
jgi:hypothetical protein